MRLISTIELRAARFLELKATVSEFRTNSNSECPLIQTL